MNPFFALHVLATSVAGIVVVDEVPVVNASVYAIPRTGATASNPLERTTTDQKGRFEFGDLAAGDWIVAAVVEKRAETVRVEAGVPLRIDIPAARSLSGRLVPGDESALINMFRPDVPEAGSVAWAMNQISEAQGHGLAVSNIPVDPPGSFRVDGLQPGRYRVEVQTKTRFGIADVDVGERETDFVVELVPAGQLHGSVVDEEGAKVRTPVRTLRLRSEVPDTTRHFLVKDGRYVVSKLMPGSYMASVVFADGTKSAEQNVDVKSGEPTAFDLRVPMKRPKK